MEATYDTTTRERAAIERWRRDQLREAGFPPRLAAALAREPGYDVHGLITLAERGCPPVLAARIVAPITTSGGSA